MDLTLHLGQIINSAIAAAFGALGAYIAIRTDLADLKARMNNVERASEVAHSRIDKMLHKE